MNCTRRSFNHDTFVCVCNAKHCDKFDPIVKTSPGIITMYLTDKNGARFDRTGNYFFMKDPLKNVDIPLSITINHNKSYQTILGFGGAFTDATGINIGKLPAELRTRLIQDYFGDDGLQYTFGRIPVGKFARNLI